MVNYWNLVDEVIAQADIVLMVVDARMVEQTRNKEIELKVKQQHKKLITVINKVDLVDKDTVEAYKQKLHPCVFVSAQAFYGMTKLRHMILRYATHTPIAVGVVGYPNTGKSSIINSLKGKSSAPVSSVSGYTKAKQQIKVDSKIVVIDTPGVIADSDDKTSTKLQVRASINVKEDPDIAAFELLKDYAQPILAYYGVDKKCADEEEMLEQIAFALHRMKKGGVADVQTAARIILQDWNKGKIPV